MFKLHIIDLDISVIRYFHRHGSSGDGEWQVKRRPATAIYIIEPPVRCHF